MPQPTLYIIYNANATLLGKLSYTCRKLTSSSAEDPACAACDITHGGLRLNESEAWGRAKRRIIDVKVEQLHIDEIREDDVKSFISTNSLKYPMVLLRPAKEPARLEHLISREELAECRGDPEVFLQRLKVKGEGFGVSVRDEDGEGGQRRSGLAKW